MNGQPLDGPATLEIGVDGRITGQAPCNRWFARGNPAPGFVLPPIGSTKRACPQLAAESAYFQALGAATTATLEDNRLVLSAPGSELVFLRP